MKFKILFVIFIAIFLFSAVKVSSYYMDKISNESLNKELQSINEKMFDFDSEDIEHVKDNIAYEVEEVKPEILSPEEEYERKISANRALFLELEEINSDVVGWLKISNTVINYPVVKGLDNDFYLYYDFNKTNSVRGTIMVDYRNTMDGLDKNIIIYGHKVEDGTMFSDLHYYKDESFYNENKYVEFSTKDTIGKWEIFSVFITLAYDGYDRTVFESDEDFKGFLDKYLGYSMYETGVTADASDTIITLSTCSYEYTNARIVVQAKLIE